MSFNALVEHLFGPKGSLVYVVPLSIYIRAAGPVLLQGKTINPKS